MNIDESQTVPVINSLVLSAALFTASGKRAATVEALEAGSARVAVGEECPDGSIAILVRHGVRVFGTLHRIAEAVARIDFDDPLDGWRQAKFIDDRRPLRPVVVAGCVAA